jgi:hypothetical protein
VAAGFSDQFIDDRYLGFRLRDSPFHTKVGLGYRQTALL